MAQDKFNRILYAHLEKDFDFLVYDFDDFSIGTGAIIEMQIEINLFNK